MDRYQLHRELIRRRHYLLTEGYLNDAFRRLEDVEDRVPDFIETMIDEFIPSVADYIQKLDTTMVTRPLNLAEVERLIIRLKGSTATLGAEKIERAVTEMHRIFMSNDTDIARVRAALERVRSEYVILKDLLEPYLVNLIRLREEEGGPPDLESDTNDDDDDDIDRNAAVMDAVVIDADIDAESSTEGSKRK